MASPLAAKTEKRWRLHYAARIQVEDELRLAFARTNFGLSPSQIAGLIDLACVVVSTYPELVSEMARTYAEAMAAQAERNAQIERRAKAAEEAMGSDAPFLEAAQPDVVRETLKGAKAAEVDQWLNALGTPAQRHEWASRLRDWVRQDGNRHDVDLLIATHCPQADEQGAGGAGDPGPAEGEAQPVGDGEPATRAEPNSVEGAQVLDGLEASIVPPVWMAERAMEPEIPDVAAGVEAPQ